MSEIDKIKQIVWVYGSLRTGEHNHYLVEGGKFLGRGIIRGFKMYSLGSFPFIYQTWKPEDTVLVEGFEIDSETCRAIDGMEKGSGYKIINTEIEVEEGGVTDGNVYVMEEIYRNYGLVKTGDWVGERNKRYLNASGIM